MAVPTAAPRESYWAEPWVHWWAIASRVQTERKGCRGKLISTKRNAVAVTRNQQCNSVATRTSLQEKKATSPRSLAATDMDA